MSYSGAKLFNEERKRFNYGEAVSYLFSSNDVH